MQILIVILMAIITATAGYHPDEPNQVALENYFNSITTHLADFSQECNPENENLQFVTDEQLKQTAHKVAKAICADGAVEEAELYMMAAHAEHRMVYIPVSIRN